MGRALPKHAPCGVNAVGDLDAAGVFVCTTVRRWDDGTAVDDLGCGRVFPLCTLHGVRGCITCHAREESPGVRGRVRALVVAAWRGQQLEHAQAHGYLEEVEHATRARLRVIVRAVAAFVSPASMLGRGARDVALDLEPGPIDRELARDPDYGAGHGGAP